MKKGLSLFIFCWLFAIARAGVAQTPDVLTLVANEWEPYTGEQILNKGLATDIVTTALRRAGYEVEVKIVPWTRALKGVEAGLYDGIIGAWFSDEREKDMRYSQPYLTNDLVFFKRHDRHVEFKKLKDLTPYQIGIMRDYAYGDEFDQAAYLKKIPGIDLRTNVIRLHKGLIDLFPEDKYVMQFILNKSYPEYASDFTFVEKPLSQRGLHLTISRKTSGNEKIVADFDAELETMKKERLLAKIISKHKLSN